MTETEWLAFTSVWQVWLPALPALSNRKFLHFLSGTMPLMAEERLCPGCRSATSLLAQVADMKAPPTAVFEQFWPTWRSLSDPTTCGVRESVRYALVYVKGDISLAECWGVIRRQWFCRKTREATPPPDWPTQVVVDFSRDGDRPYRAPQPDQANEVSLGMNHPEVMGEGPVAAMGLLCELLGNPFHPAPVDTAWSTPTVIALAQVIYRDRAFDRLPILADALEDAGCTDRTILDHLRGPGTHVRGCFALDLVLDKH
jgi:hypothetical protein